MEICNLKPGDVITVSGQRFTLYAIEDGILYGVDFETEQMDAMFLLKDTEFEVEYKPDNVECLFLKRREANMRFIKKFRGF
jgi:hypothetical protein